MMLHHYIVVRRDLSRGATLAAVAHAAGESFYHIGVVPRSLGVDEFMPSETIAVILGARSEARLKTLVLKLDHAEVAHVAITETDGAYAGQLLAVGLVPCAKARVAPLLKDFHLFPETE